jgi:hypothetical protein
LGNNGEVSYSIKIATILKAAANLLGFYKKFQMKVERSVDISNKKAQPWLTELKETKKQN